MVKQKGTIWLTMGGTYRLQVLLTCTYVIKQGLFIEGKVVEIKLPACIYDSIPSAFIPLIGSRSVSFRDSKTEQNNH